MRIVSVLEEIREYFKGLPVVVFEKSSKATTADEFDPVLYKNEAAECYTLYVGYEKPFTDFKGYRYATLSALSRCFAASISGFQAHIVTQTVAPTRGTCIEQIGSATVVGTIKFEDKRPPVTREKTVKVERKIEFLIYPSVETARSAFENSNAHFFSTDVFETTEEE